MKTASWWLVSFVVSGMIILLCFCGATGGSTLFKWGDPYIMEIPRCLIVCMEMRCALQPFGIKLYLRPMLLWESTPVRLTDCQASTVFGWQNMISLIGNPFLWPTVSRWAVRVISWSSNQLWYYCVSRVPGQISLEVTSGIKSWSRTIAMCVQRLFIHQSLDNRNRICRGFLY